MSLWEYKIITSGKGGFASPALLEKFLNDLGREEWEIVAFHSQPENFLVFAGLARRPTQRDWTLEGAAAAAAKAEADKLRAEFEAKFKAATSNAPAAEERPASFLEEKVAPDDGFRKPIDTSHDADEDEPEKDEDDWDKLTAAEEDELPTFFDAIKPHMRRNQRGPGMSVGVDYLAKKWDQSEDDLKGALVECGFTIPADEDAKPEYLEFEGDLYWVNVNRRGELWINTKEKPRPVFRSVKGQKAVVEEDAPKQAKKREPIASTESVPAKGDVAAPVPSEPAADSGAPGGSLPAGPELLEKIRPLMRRNRRGPGGSGSASFLSRALKCREADLVAAFKSLGLVVPGSANDKPTNVEIANGVWWINVDSRGNVWINGRDKKPGESLESGASSSSGEPSPMGEAAASLPVEASRTEAEADAVPTPEIVPAVTAETSGRTPSRADTEGAAAVPTATGAAILASLRPLLKQTRTGANAAKIENLAAATGKSIDDLLPELVAAGLAVPEKPREKPVFVSLDREILWLNRNAKGELWLNAKTSKFADGKSDGGDEGAGSVTDGADAKKEPRRGRARKKPE